jgi:nucleotide-binding universal stress UspA family protein
MADPEPIQYRRIMVQMDTSSHCRDMLDAAIDIAARLQADLNGVFVEDRDLISVGRLDFVREFSLSSSAARTLDDKTLDAQLKALASSARRRLENAGRRRNVPVGFRTVRENVSKNLENAAGDADLIIAEATGRLHSRAFRARMPGRALAHSSTRPTLLLKGGKSLSGRFAVVCDSIENARRCLAAAQRLPVEKDGGLVLIPCAGKAADGDKLASELVTLAAEQGQSAEVAGAVGLDAAAVFTRTPRPDSLLIAADPGPLLEQGSNGRMLLESRHPLLLVH